MSMQDCVLDAERAVDDAGLGVNETIKFEVLDAKSKGREVNAELLAESMLLAARDEDLNQTVGLLERMIDGKEVEAEVIPEIENMLTRQEIGTSAMFVPGAGGKMELAKRGFFEEHANVSWMCQLIDTVIHAYATTESGLRTRLQGTKITSIMQGLSRNKEITPDDMKAAAAGKASALTESWREVREEGVRITESFGLSKELLNPISDHPPIPLDHARLTKLGPAGWRKVLEENGMIPNLWPTGEKVNPDDYARESYIFHTGGNFAPMRFLRRRGGAYPDKARAAYSLDFGRIRGADHERPPRPGRMPTPKSMTRWGCRRMSATLSPRKSAVRL